MTKGIGVWLLLCFVSTTQANTKFEANGLTIKIEAHHEHCFYEDIKSVDSKIYFAFQVTTGGALDIDSYIDAGTQRQFWSAEREESGRVLFKAPTEGTYKFCLSNKMSTLTAKTVQFNLAVGDPTEGEVVPGLGPLKFNEKRRPDRVQRSIIRIGEGLRNIQEVQNYMATREHEHLREAEHTKNSVLTWAVLESIILVMMSVMQVVYLRRCFEVKRQI